jgi:subtilisin family serine protease
LNPRGKPVRRLVLLFASMLASTLMLAGSALTQAQPAVDGADRYIVVLEEGVEHPSQVASEIERRQEDLDVGSVYDDALEGFSAEIPEEDLAAVRANPQVAFIERDMPVYIVAQTVPWGIERIGADESSTVAGDHSGVVSGANAYIIDTGIDQSHSDLNVVNHVNFTGDGKNFDCNGHGTHVAGTVAAEDDRSDVVGVAPGARLTGVKVIGCRGRGSSEDLIDGIEWVTDNARKPAIANISLSTGAVTEALDRAVRRSARSGIFYAVAAGNDDPDDRGDIGEDACSVSPAHAGLALRDTNGDGKINYEDSNGIVTTAATNRRDKEPSWSNYGRCVDLWAPGVRILSTKKGGGTRYFSGTSMAAPHVAGTAALYLSTHRGATPVAVERQLKADSTITDTESKNGAEIRLVDASRY